MRVFLWRAAVELASIQLVQLPLHPKRLFSHIPGFKSDQLRPAKPRISESHHSYELIVPPREQGATLGYLQYSQRSSDGLFGTSMSRSPGALAASRSSGGGIGG